MQRQLRGLDYRTQHLLYTCSGGSMCKPLRLHSRMLLCMLPLTLRHRHIYAWSPDTSQHYIVIVFKANIIFLYACHIRNRDVTSFSGWYSHLAVAHSLKVWGRWRLSYSRNQNRTVNKISWAAKTIQLYRMNWIIRLPISIHFGAGTISKAPIIVRSFYCYDSMNVSLCQES